MDLLEGGIRVPLLARWPARIPAGQTSDTPCMTMDWTATFLAAAGVAPHPDYPLDGVDLSPVFTDPGWQRPGDLCWRMKFRQQRALVRWPWKYLQVDGIDYLFDLSRDQRERANLARLRPEWLAELSRAWQAWDAGLPPIPNEARAHSLWTTVDMPKASN